MGFKVQLIAIEGKSPEKIHSDYGVISSGKFVDSPEPPVLGMVLPNGKYLLYINDEILPGNDVMYRLSKNASLLSCYANETVMESHLCLWVNGAEKWLVSHDAQENIRHLEIDGPVPNEIEAIQSHLFAEQETSSDADLIDYIFDVPIELFVALGGIRYDQIPESENQNPWEILERR